MVVIFVILDANYLLLICEEPPAVLTDERQTLNFL
jgi:hypothetical protein